MYPTLKFHRNANERLTLIMFGDLSPYHAVSTLNLDRKDQSVDDVEGNYRCLFLESYETQIHNMWAEHRIFLC
jgi:hypothetical protein